MFDAVRSDDEIWHRADCYSKRPQRPVGRSSLAQVSPSSFGTTSKARSLASMRRACDSSRASPQDSRRTMSPTMIVPGRHFARLPSRLAVVLFRNHVIQTELSTTIMIFPEDPSRHLESSRSAFRRGRPPTDAAQVLQRLFLTSDLDQELKSFLHCLLLGL